MEKQIRELIMPLSEQLIKQLTARLEAVPKGEVTLYWLELTVVAVLTVLARQMMVGIMGVVWGRGYEGYRLDCPRCGQSMKFQRYARRPVISGFGRFSYERAYYYCAGCRAGWGPLDQQLGVGRRELSPRLQRVIGFLSGHLSFAVVSHALQETYEIAVSDEAIRQVAEEIGDDARVWEDHQREEVEADPAMMNPSGLPPQTWILEIDGKKVGFQDGTWNEVKIGIIYELEDRVEVHTGHHALVKRELIARRCDWLEFAHHFWVAMRRAGVRPGDRLVALADGATALEQIFALVAPEAQRIRDFYHVAERLYAIGQLRYGSQTVPGQRWIQGQLEKLKDSEVSSVIRSIAHLQLPSAEAQQTRTEILGYLQNQRPAMDYASYQQQGLPIGSGAVEGGCRLIGARTNGCGRRWGPEGVDAIVALRVAVLNDRLDLIRPRPLIQWEAVA